MMKSESLKTGTIVKPQEIVDSAIKLKEGFDIGFWHIVLVVVIIVAGMVLKTKYSRKS